MTRSIFVDLPGPMYGEVIAHLLRDDSDLEQAAFGFAERVTEGETLVFRIVEWMPVSPEGFEVQLAYHLELTDAMKASVIKRAHDLGATLIEFHCHTGRWPAAFSLSDRVGFREFVPHVLWRLKGRPYVAVVVARSGRDGLAWIEKMETPERIVALRAGGVVHRCTGLTPLSMDIEL
jgi:hypothetical protein